MTTTLDRKVAVKQASHDRRELLNLGYTPLPSRGKLCLLRDWPNVQPDDKMIELWGRNLNLCSTGIRLEGQQIAIDLDVLDEELVEAILDKLWDHWPELDDAPQRVGRAPKVLYLAQLAEGEAPLTVMSTKRWKNKAGDLEHVEVFGGGRSRFIGWRGPHTLEDQPGPDGWIVHRTYDDADTLVPADQLPVITMAQLRAWLADCDTIFQLAGYEEHRQQAGASSAFVRDLTEEMRFECDDGILREGIEAMVQYASHDEHARCALSFLDANATNTTRCRVSLSSDGELRVFDFGDWVTHAPVGGALAPKPVDLQSLGGVLASLGFGVNTQELAQAQGELETAEAPLTAIERIFIREGGDMADFHTEECERSRARFEAAYEDLMKNMVYDRVIDGTRHRLRAPEVELTVNRRAVAYAKDVWMIERPTGQPKKVNPVMAWITSDDHKVVDGTRFRPGEDVVFTDDEGTWLNLWREVELDPALVSTEAAMTWFKFLEHLIPDERERDWFDRFVAHKMINPRHRGAAILMVAASIQGAGRSTLMAVLHRVFGGYAAMITGRHLFDSQMHSGWKEKALWAFGNEVKFSTRYGDRVEAYEHLKDIVDPAQNRVRLEEKYARAKNAAIFTTFLLATNQPDALPITDDDRRFMIITNGGTMPAALREELYGGWYDGTEPGDALVHTLRAYYQSRGEALTAEEKADLTDAPKWPAGRARMLEAGETDVDAAFRDALDRIAPERIAISRKDLENLLRGELRVQELEQKRGAIRPFINRLHGAEAAAWGWELLPTRLKLPGRHVAVVCRTGIKHFLEDMSMADREKALEATGPVALVGRA